MLSGPTVLVLGAGASKPYGLFTAAELKDAICHNPKVVIVNQHDRDDADMKAMIGERMRRVGVALAFSGQASIDAFLERRSEFLEDGKLMIAAHLLPQEVRAVASTGASSDWYGWLFQKLQTDKTLVADHLSIVTFNYDRTFEFAFRRMLCNSFRLTEDRAVEVLKPMKVVHVYGALNGPQSLDEFTMATRGISDGFIHRAAQGIRIISEHREPNSDPGLAQARHLLEKASVVIFLGFGYDVTNLSRIGAIESNPRWSAGKKTVCGTAFGLRPKEREVAQRALGRDVVLGGEREDCLEFLRSHISF